MPISLTQPVLPGYPRDSPLEGILLRIQTALNALTAPSVRTVFANGPVYSTDWLLLVDASAGAVSVTLPLSAQGTRPITVKKADASGNAVTVYASGTEKIDGASTKALAAQYNSATFIPDPRGGWWIQ